jgi:hypothetical protein
MNLAEQPIAPPSVTTDRLMNLSEESIAFIHECKTLIRSQLTAKFNGGK